MIQKLLLFFRSLFYFEDKRDSFSHSSFKTLKFHFLYVFLFICFSVNFAEAQNIWNNSITGINPQDTNPYVSGQTKDANITVVGIKRSSSLGNSIASYNDSFVAKGWTTANAINTGDYFEFTLAANTCYKINFSQFIYASSYKYGSFICPDPEGPQSFAVRSSVDNYASDIATPSAAGGTINLTGAAFQNITSSITFRVYGYKNSSDFCGVWGIDNFAFTGSVVSTSPTITTSSTPAVVNSVCQSATAQTTIMPYSATTNSPTSYSIDWSSLADQGSTSITFASGSSNVTGISVPAGTPAGTYTGTMTISNANGCTGTKAISMIVNTTVGTPVFTLGATSTRCQGAGSVTYTASATNTTAITYTLDAASVTGGNSINPATGAVTYVATWNGTSTITASAAGCNGPKTAAHTVTITPTVGTPSFTLGATTTRCQGAGSVTYTASATNITAISYTLDAASVTGGNSINPATGAVTYVATWNGTSTITASAAGCNGPATATHTATITPTVGTPSFTLGATTTRCQGAGSVTYTAAATNTTAITYTLDAASVTGGNSINTTNGAVTYVAGWIGTSTITASAAGCNGPATATHTVTITPTVGTPSFTLGATTTRCQGAGSVTYTASATNTTAITYTLDAASVTGGNSINAATGAVTYVAGWIGTSTITASAAGCNGPKTATHTVTITPTVGTPSFTLGATTTRCQGAGSVTYTASATNTTGITYTLDAASVTGGNSINTTNGAVTYVAGWIGTSTITASAAGCNGPKTATHTVTITPTVGTPSFTLGATTTRCQGAGSVTYTASATNTTAITYTLDAASVTGGNSINTTNGAVTYVATWNGTSTITASAAGCNGPATATHTATITPTVGTPSFTLGATTTRCQGVGSVTYTASATNTTAITYTLDAASVTGGNSINTTNGAVTYVAGWIGTSTITASAAGCNGPATATHTVTITPTVGTPSFTLGATTTRCQGAGSVTYTASATNTTAITYTLDAASVTGGNSINTTNGAVTYVAGWIGTSTITASAAGCNGPATATHTVTITPTAGTPSFTLGATTTRCQGAGSVTYTASATNITAISYTLDAASVTGGNSINPATGAVTYVAGWIGTSTITASAAGCNGPKTATHTVTITPTVGTPSFTLGATTTRCQGVGSVTYTASATNTTAITYNLDAASVTGGNSINAATGAVTYVATWNGTSTITASATGCNGPATATHTVTITPTVGTPSFTLGATTTRCQGAGSVTYTASATNTTAITYTLDAASVTGGNSINPATGAVTYVATWNGTSTITASATGCNGPATATHTVTITPTPTTPTITAGGPLTFCAGDSVILTSSTGTTYLWSNGATTQSITVSTSGIYSVQITNAAGCQSAASVGTTVNSYAKTWLGLNKDWTDGANWSPSGIPTNTDCVVISGTVPFQPETLPALIKINSITINNGGLLTIQSQNVLDVNNGVTINAGGNLIFEDDSSLLQTNPNSINTGNIIYKRNTTPVRRYDYTYWSTPVTNTPAPTFKLSDLSPDTLVDKFFSYSPSSGWVYNNYGTQVMEPGMGYNVRAPQTFEIDNPKIYNAQFTGIPNNGTIPVTPVIDKFNLLGNPYPSGLDARNFISTNNTGALYFWTHTSSPTSTGNGTYAYASADYATFTMLGGSGAGSLNFQNPPNGIIAAGQAFFIKATSATSIPIIFTNGMRVGAGNTQFYKTTNAKTPDLNRIWLNLTNKQGAFKQVLLGYADGATNSWDVNYDGPTMSGNSYVDFYSINDAKKLTIQGRALPFDDSDLVPFGYVTKVAGDFTIAIDHADGFFDTQAVYLEDKKTGKITDLRAENYTFTTAIGTFTDRFVLRYTNKTLGTGDFENVENGLLISVKDKIIKTTSSKEIIKEVTIFDISGKLLYEKKKVGTTELEISNLKAADQVLLVKVLLENGYSTTRKIIF